MKCPFSKKELIRDNAMMTGQLKWCSRVIDEQLKRNIELQMENEQLKAMLQSEEQDLNYPNW